MNYSSSSHSCLQNVTSIFRGSDFNRPPGYNPVLLLNWHTQSGKGTLDCKDGISMIQTRVNDLVPDCAGAEDEELYVNLLKHRDYMLCDSPNQIPCVPGHPVCYNVSQICVYRLNVNNDLTPCRTGSHIQNCEHFECSGKFKCPHYYCLPWLYVCDGKWDCPKGKDEENICDNRTCENMFKCKHSQICIHLHDLCNNIIDCPVQDDEKLCDLNRPTKLCPDSCHCLNYAIWFHNTEVKLEKWPYVSLHFSFCSIKSVNLDHQTHVIFVNFPHNSIEDLSPNIPKNQNFVSFNISFNLIKWIKRHSLFAMKKLKMIILNDNKISLLERDSFRNLNNLFLINLARNAIHNLPSNIFRHVSLHVLSFVGNSLGKMNPQFVISDHLVIKLIATKNYVLCCIKPPNTLCGAQKPSFASCSQLLPRDSSSVMIITLCVLITILNFVTIGKSVQEYKNKSAKQKKSVNMIFLQHVLDTFYLPFIFS